MPDRDNDVVIVNATDIENDSPDTTCIVTPADHPYFTLPKSVIFYQKAYIFGAANFEGLIKHGQFKPRQPASDELIARIRRGARDSEKTPLDVWEMVGRCPWRPAART